MDVVVIGGGIAGASAASELAAAARVVLVEREAVCGYHTTGRSAAIFTEAYERGVVQALAVGSRGYLEERGVLSPQPLVMIGTEEQRPRVEEAVVAARRLVPLARQVGAAELVELCPVLRPGYAAVGALEPEAAGIDVAALHQGYLAEARRRGAEVRTGWAVTGLRRDGSSWLVKGSDGDELRADAVVDAAGAWADEVARLAEVQPAGLQPYRRTAFTFAAPAGVDVAGLPMVIDADERFYFEPEGEGFLGSLAEETPMHPHDVRPEEADVALAIERLEAATMMTIRHVRSAWAGLRTFAPDRHPVIGEDPQAAGFWWLAGQGGFGIMTSPAAARTLAGMLLHGDVPADLADLGVTAAGIEPGRLQPA